MFSRRPVCRTTTNPTAFKTMSSSLETNRKLSPMQCQARSLSKTFGLGSVSRRKAFFTPIALATFALLSAHAADAQSITRDVWTGVSGATVAEIPVGTAPSSTGTLTSFETPTDIADNYGQRVRGYLTAPTSGSYTFWIAGDDNVELRLSTNNQVSTNKIAFHTSWTASRDWNKFTTQKSAAITLIAGQQYYIEALMKEATGGDNLAVGWAKPGQATTLPSEVIPGSVLSTTLSAGKLTGTIIGTIGSWSGTASDDKSKALDGSLTTFFDAPTGVAWVGLDFGSSKTLSGVKYAPRSGWASRMTGGKIQGSTTADFSSGVTDLFTISGVPTEGVLTSQTISGIFPYARYLSPVDGWGNIAELEFYGVGGATATPTPTPTPIPTPTPTPIPTPTPVVIAPLRGNNGGGWTKAGLTGEYFANGSLTGTPSFTRQDIRLDFDWGTGKPGGSNFTAIAAVPADNFSVRWTGQLVPRFGETYNFKAFADDQLKLELKPSTSSTWTTVFDRTSNLAAAVTGTYVFVAGQRYDVRIEFREVSGTATARLLWSSPSTPEEVIEPLGTSGITSETYTATILADAMKGARTEGWRDPDFTANSSLWPTMDANGWPQGDGTIIVWEGQDVAQTAGTYFVQFKGQAQVSARFGDFSFAPLGSATFTPTLAKGVGYDAATNTTQALMRIANSHILYFRLDQTQRTAASAVGSGVTDIKLMKPIAPGSSTYHEPSETFTRSILKAFSNVTSMRMISANGNTDEVAWSDRRKPTSQIWPWSGRVVWEAVVMLANETGKDMWITIPVAANDDYFLNLARLVRYGSDANGTPYTSTQANPVYPPLNPNLKLYIELANEMWNNRPPDFPQTAWASTRAQLEIDSNTAVGQIINYDGAATNAYVARMRRWYAYRTVQASKIFRSVFEPTNTSTRMDRIRPVDGWQYDNGGDTAYWSLSFVDNYYNNADGVAHVTDPKPVSYYLWGGSPAAYYGSADQSGSQSTIVVPNASAENNSDWTFSGTAGYVSNQGWDGQAVGSGNVDTPSSNGTRAIAVTNTGSASVQVNFSQTGKFALAYFGVNRFRRYLEGGVLKNEYLGNEFDIYIDGQRVTPNYGGAMHLPRTSSYSLGSGSYGRNSLAWEDWGSAVIDIATPGLKTVQFVGRGVAGQTSDLTTYFDNIRVASVDALFASGIPGAGSATGQVGQQNYVNQLNSQTRYATAYGLNSVAYESGWSLGGDFNTTPLQAYAKYVDPRAKDVNNVAIDAIDRAGYVLNTLGSYDQWYSPDTFNFQTYPLAQSMIEKNDVLRKEVTNGIGLPATLTQANGTWLVNAYGTILNQGWIDWVVLAPTSGTYNIQVSSSAGGTAAVSVDGVVRATFDSKDGLTRAPIVVDLARGQHSIRVRSRGGEFVVTSVEVKSGVGAASGPALALAELQGEAYNASTVAFDAVAAGVTTSSISRGAGLLPAPYSGWINGYSSTRIGTVNWGITESEAVARDQYVQWTVTPDVGKKISLSSVFYNAWAQDLPPNLTTVLRYSVDGTNFSTASTTQTSPRGGEYKVQADLSGIVALQNRTSAVTLRVYFVNMVSESLGLGRQDGNDVVVNGQVANQ